MQCPRCGAENTGNRSSCWSCFAQLDEGAAAPRLITVQPPQEPEPIKRAQENKPATTEQPATQQQDSATPEWLNIAHSEDDQQEEADQSKYIVPGLASPAAQQATEEEEEVDHSPWKTNPVPQPQPVSGPAAAPAVSMPATVPDGVNWGGFLLPFFWSIAHKAWLWVVLSFFFAPIASVVLLITGNKVALQNRQFASMDEFKKVQKAWTIWGLVIDGVGIAASIALWATFIAIFFAAFKNAKFQQGVSPTGFPPGINMKGGMVPGGQGMPGIPPGAMPGMPPGMRSMPMPPAMPQRGPAAAPNAGK